jgi:hypothetical protein
MGPTGEFPSDAVFPWPLGAARTPGAHRGRARNDRGDHRAIRSNGTRGRRLSESRPPARHLGWITRRSIGRAGGARRGGGRAMRFCAGATRLLAPLDDRPRALAQVTGAASAGARRGGGVELWGLADRTNDVVPERARSSIVDLPRTGRLPAWMRALSESFTIQFRPIRSQDFAAHSRRVAKAGQAFNRLLSLLLQTPFPLLPCRGRAP